MNENDNDERSCISSSMCSICHTQEGVAKCDFCGDEHCPSCAESNLRWCSTCGQTFCGCQNVHPCSLCGRSYCSLCASAKLQACGHCWRRFCNVDSDCAGRVLKCEKCYKTFCDSCHPEDGHSCDDCGERPLCKKCIYRCGCEGIVHCEDCGKEGGLACSICDQNLMSDCLPTLKEDSDDDTNFCVEITKEEFKAGGNHKR